VLAVSVASPRAGTALAGSEGSGAATLTASTERDRPLPRADAGWELSMLMPPVPLAPPAVPAPAVARSAPLPAAPALPPSPLAPFAPFSLALPGAATPGSASALGGQHLPPLLLATAAMCWLVPRASWRFTLTHRRLRGPPGRPPFSPG